MGDATTERRLRTDETWIHHVDPRMPEVAHGWKLHVSARPATLDDVVARVLPVLDEYVCHMKHARTPEILRALNSGFRSPGAVGKAVTVYPDPGGAAELGYALVEALNGMTGPRVLSDMRISPSAPVYYRYGPFEATYRTGAGGRLESVMIGPDGQAFDGLAVGRYRCPPWAVDPFHAVLDKEPLPPLTPKPAKPSALLADGRYQITAGIVRAAHGNVYRGFDRALSLPVVLKQARAFVAEDESGLDAQDRLRHERSVLEALDGIDGIPRLVDYFPHGTDEFLVLDDRGARDLRRDVLENGPFRPGDPDRDPLALADRLAGILDRIHQRGVVVRDVKPNNIVLDASGDCHLVDFGISALDGVAPGGATLGYTDPDRPRGAADPADDFYALGVTLGFAATGLDPVVIDQQPTVNRDRTLTGLEAAEIPSAVATRIRTLMNVSGESRMPPVPDEELLDQIISHTVGYCAEAAREMVRDGSTPIDVYAGSSGLGWELLQHREQPGVADVVDLLARWTARQDRERDLSASLYSGRTGVALFLQQAGVSDSHDDSYNYDDLVPRDRIDGRPPEADLIEGAAGIGLGHLLLARSSHARDHHLAAAAECHRIITGGIATLTPTDAAKPGNAALAEGIAHGEAGVAYFLTEYGHAAGDPEAVAAARAACERLAALTPAIIARALAPEGSRRYGSWCRGLAGIGGVFIRAVERLGEPRYLELAEQCADVCVLIAPRMPQVVQCCGLAGVGDFLIDLAQAQAVRGVVGMAGAADADRRWAEAGTVARLILARSGGTWSRPVFPDVELTRASAGWAGGTSGVLGFLRRLRDRGGVRLATA
ncbi:protein kinase/lanthionine synthetase C family protein [Catenulispora sp. NF23]|uniref:class III lanthionine synthetase LanKC N-terminal domain-containing protein n=1 Tax=Catenulispora pinistramenti TaxID=2705254 RepID=UPI001BA5C6E3|nr:lanthionine synthetase LanC family protein [Catenulispora pinistramenti]MBS2539430.1 protein kinase/lanthionine synthetase C family protein [Catenulispora pinistramenti]